MIDANEPLQITVGEVVRTADKRPCLIYQEIILNRPSTVSHLVFRNHYSAFIRIMFKEESGDVYETLTSRHDLMKDPHSEDDAQSWHCIDFRSAFQRDISSTVVQSFQLYYFQPSPNWRQIGVQQISLFSKIWKVRRFRKMEIQEDVHRSVQRLSDSAMSITSGSSDAGTSQPTVTYIDPDFYSEERMRRYGAVLFSDFSKLKAFKDEVVAPSDAPAAENFYFSDDFEEISGLVVDERT